MSEIKITMDASALAKAGAQRFAQLAEAAIGEHGRFAVALSGGSTPRGVYTLLAEPPLVETIDWQKVFVFWGDDRCVPPGDPDSDYRMAREALLDRAPIPKANIFRIEGELGAQPAASAYEAVLRSFFSSRLPRFDLIFLGLGEDGHTASLFPGSPGLAERERWVIGVEHFTPPEPLVDRVTLTPPALNAAAEVIFLVSGLGKADRLAQVLRGPYQPEALPAQVIHPVNGRLLWLVDRAAASQLNDAGVQ